MRRKRKRKRRRITFGFFLFLRAGKLPEKLVTIVTLSLSPLSFSPFSSSPTFREMIGEGKRTGDFSLSSVSPFFSLLGDRGDRAPILDPL